MLKCKAAILFSIFLFIFSITTFSKPQKKATSGKKFLEAFRIAEEIKIDGFLNESDWERAQVATDFYQYEPFNGSFPSEKTEVRVLFDDEAIYIGAILFDTNPENIYCELGQRDNSDNLKSDAFSVLLSTYNDGINYQDFIVSASGVQTDIMRTGNSSDRSWNAVWTSKVSINEQGWIVEMKIPFSALRFSKNSATNWGLNFRRLIKRYNEWDTWNPIDNSISGIVNQSGELSGISDIKPPLRLSFSPYISAYVEKFPNSKSLNYRLNGGMDVKVGLSESFTLDMTLIPDFGQVKSDEKVLNISPFEVKYDEQRPFFIEGMDLFDKGNIFYSRRIGSKPSGYHTISDSLRTNEIVAENPSETSMINATKISGRTAKGLGVGFFNAITSEANALIKDTVSGAEREVATQGLTNYNMLVLDQTLPNNSYVSLANTNLLHPYANYYSNVTATDFIFRNKTTKYALQGVGAVSQIYADSSTIGYKSYLVAQKTSGNFLFNVWNNIESEQYNPNDLGYLQKANEFSNGVEVGYKIYQPFWKLLNWNSWVGFSHNQLYNPRVYNKSSVYVSLRTTITRSYLTLGTDFSFNPKETHDYDEPRTNDRMLIRPRNISGSFWTSSDYRKPVALDTGAGYWKAEDFSYNGLYVSLSPRLRFSNNFFVVYEVRQDFENNNLGYAGKSDNEIYMGFRDVSTLTNTINGLLSFNSLSNINLRIRHYWRWIDYSSYHTLYDDGTLSAPLENHNMDNNINFNLFNIDLTYQWNFAPGSELSVVWKNAIELSNGDVRSNFFSNFGDVLSSGQVNSLSFKILYYIDYQHVKNSFIKGA
ncbi:MAG TPA: DUF5916 domain-containing protein [Tenuifilaceae bacterium]|nr:DUF5916 domain-containing protein [Tenuifilaceae bacterium]HRX68267.1 DUF5916 domain-containing protein [Tenuifilaceae bacterium]